MNIFPIEIMIHIFKYFDTKTLSACMLVNKQWRQIAEKAIEGLQLWDLMVENEIINNGFLTFVNKCALENRNIFKNFVLYNYIAMATIKRIKVYRVPKVEKIVVCKDNFILFNDLRICYYDINTLKKTRIIKRTCIDYDESPTMIAFLIEERDNTKSLYLYAKSDTERDINKLHKVVVKIVKSFRLENKACYVLATRILYRLTYTMEWVREGFNGYYCEKPSAIHAHNGTIYTVSNDGFIMRIEIGGFITEHLRFPWNTKNINKMVIFDKFSAAIPVHTTQKRLNIVRNRQETTMVLEYLNMSCGVMHGEVLFLGFSDGGVEILLPKTMFKDNSKLNFNIRDYIKADEDYEIVTINVSEMINSHILFIGTNACVYQFELVYPEILF